MSDEIAFIVALVLAGGGLLALMNWLANVDRKRAEMTEEEYQNQERSPGLIGAGMMALDEFIRPEMKRAIEYRIDAEQGHLPGGDQQGEKLPEDERQQSHND
jgi:hypothetical protein